MLSLFKMVGEKEQKPPQSTRKNTRLSLKAMSNNSKPSPKKATGKENSKTMASKSKMKSTKYVPSNVNT